MWLKGNLQMDGTSGERKGFILFLVLITLALIAVAWTFAAPLLWAVLGGIMFQPLYLRLLARMKGGENRAALATLLIITIAVILPLLAIGAVIVDQATQIYLGMKGQEIDFAVYFDQVHQALPARLQELMNSSGYGEFEALRSRAAEFLQDSAGFLARYAVNLGGNAFAFVLSFIVGLYVMYFLLRDGRRLGPQVIQALPLETPIAQRLADTFVSIVRATIKGTVVVSMVQGALGTITLWITGVSPAVLLGVLMAIVSLLPAFGPAIVWVPVAVYLLATGAIWQGLVVIASGIFVIGMADNVLRPMLVGRDTGLPDWIVLIATLGGIATMGLSGIVVGPVIAGLFLAGWTIYGEQRVTVGQAPGTP